MRLNGWPLLNVGFARRLKFRCCWIGTSSNAQSLGGWLAKTSWAV